MLVACRAAPVSLDASVPAHQPDELLLAEQRAAPAVDAGVPDQGSPSLLSADAGSEAGATPAGATKPAEPDRAVVLQNGPPPPPCSPHVDAIDPALKFNPVQVGYRQVKTASDEAVELIALDGAGACAFDEKRPAAFLGLRMSLPVVEEIKPYHYVLGPQSAGLSASFVASGPQGAVSTTAASAGVVDLMAVRGRQLAIGFNLKTPAGDAFGCFEATPCP